MSDQEPRRRVQHPGGGKSRTKQADAASVDIKAILGRYINTGLVSQRREPGTYGDFSSASTFSDAMNRVREAEEQFMLLPAEIRRACDHDPAVFLEKVFSPEGRAELEQVGLVENEAPVGAPPSKPSEEAAGGQADVPADPA